MEGLAPSGWYYEICPTSPANVILARYCSGGAIPAHLGNPVNTVVIAHPATLISDQIRAIKVVLPRPSQLSVSLASFFRSPLLGCWPKVNHDQYYFSICIIIFGHPTQMIAYFEDKDVHTAQAIFKEKGAKHDRVDYEFRDWKGEFLFLIMSACLIRSACVETAHDFAMRPI